MEYLFVMYESIAHFNRESESYSRSWRIKDFRIIESPTHINGLLVLWERPVNKTTINSQYGRQKVELRSDGEWPK